MMIFSTILMILMGAATAYLAVRRGRDPYIWFAIGILLGIFGLIILFILPPVNKEDAPAEPQVVGDAPVVQELLADKEWFYLDSEGKQQGPLYLDALKKVWDDEKIDESTFVWSEGMDKWLRARDVHGFVESCE